MIKKLQIIKYLEKKGDGSYLSMSLKEEEYLSDQHKMQVSQLFDQTYEKLKNESQILTKMYDLMKLM